MIIITWNIHSCKGLDGVRSVERITDQIAEMAADIVCLQEVERRWIWRIGEDQPAHIAAKLGFACIFQNNLRSPVGQFGNAILSRYPLLNRRDTFLPNTLERRRPGLAMERRGLLEAQIDTPAGLMAVATSHWSLELGDRLSAAQVAIGQINGAGIPFLFAGDLNAPPESSEITQLISQTGLIDSGSDGNVPTFSSNDPRWRIDYILHSPALVAKSLRTVPTDASDHCLLVLEIMRTIA